MAVVYIWNENHNSWGHASVEVDGVYISWWPTDSKSKSELKKKKIEGATKDRLPNDYTDERNNFTGRSADHVFNIPKSKIDPGKIKEWWRQKVKEGYHFLLNNCCDVALQALRAGGASIGGMVISTPAKFVNLCQELSR